MATTPLVNSNLYGPKFQVDIHLLSVVTVLASVNASSPFPSPQKTGQYSGHYINNTAAG